MSQQLITNGESGLNVLNAINANFTEVYGALNFPLRNEGITGNSTVVIPANTVITGMLVRPDAGSPVVSIGDAPGSGDMLGSQPLTQTIPVQMFWPMLTGGTIYITLSGGTISVVILTVKNVF